MGEQKRKKNISVGLLAHVDAGKTTLAESILYTAGAIRKQGRVDSKDSALDTHALEKERGITIFAGEAVFTLGDKEITLLDTPGHIDFSAETERTLSVLDYAILVISSLDGVQSHTRTVWRLLKTYNIPTFIFVTKCDMARRTNGDIEGELEKEFGSVVNFQKNNGTFVCAEKLATADEKLLEEYLECGSFSDASICEAISKRNVFPLFFGSGLKNDGVEYFLSQLDTYLCDKEYKKEFGAKVYKITHDKTERLTKLKVKGGVLKVKDSIEYCGITEKINEIRIYSGAKYVSVSEAVAGTVCAVTGLSKTFSGQGIGDEGNTEKSILEPVISYRIVLPDGCDPKQTYPKLKLLEEEDPKLKVSYNEQIGEFHVAFMGTVQAEIFKGVVKERFGMDIEIAEGRVMYKETVCEAVEGVGHYEPLRHYSEVHLLLEPMPVGSGVLFDNRCDDVELNRTWQRLIMTHLAEKTHLGVLTGSPITDIKITLLGGKAHLKHTEGGDFRQSTYRAVRQGLMRAKCKLLEPYYSFRLEVPSKFIGRAITDIKLMGGTVNDPETVNEMTLLTGVAPASAMNGYLVEVVSYTAGLGSLSLEFSGYYLCHNEQEVLENTSYNPETDLENTPDSVFCAKGAGFAVKWCDVEKYMDLDYYFKK